MTSVTISTILGDFTVVLTLFESDKHCTVQGGWGGWPTKDEFKYSRVRTLEHFLGQFNYFFSSTESNFNRIHLFQAKMTF